MVEVRGEHPMIHTEKGGQQEVRGDRLKQRSKEAPEELASVPGQDTESSEVLFHGPTVR